MYLVYKLLPGLDSSTSYSIKIHLSRPASANATYKQHFCHSFHKTISSSELPTIPLFKFLFIIQKACGGDSPLLVIITQISVTTKALQGIVGLARRNVTYVLADELFTFAERPNGVLSRISESGKILSLPSYIILEK